MPLVFYPPQPVADPYTHELRPDLFGAEVTVTDPATGQPLTGLVEANSGAPMGNPVRVGPTGYTPSMAKEDGPPFVNIVSGDFTTPIWSPSGAVQYMGDAQAAIAAMQVQVEASAQAAQEAASGVGAPADTQVANLLSSESSQTRATALALIGEVAPDAPESTAADPFVASLFDTDSQTRSKADDRYAAGDLARFTTSPTDVTADVQARIDEAAAAGGGTFVLSGRHGVRLPVAGTIHVKDRVTVIQEAGVVVERVGASTAPVVRIGGREAVYDGPPSARIETTNASPNGAVLFGPPDLTTLQQTLSSRLGPLTLVGVEATGNVGVRLWSSFVANGADQCYQNTVDGTSIRSFGTAVYASDVANANTFQGVQVYDIKDVVYDFHGNTAFRGADENLVLGGFVHHSAGVTVVRGRNVVYNQVIGLCLEPGADAIPYNLDATSQSNRLIISSNTALAGIDQGSKNVVDVNGLSIGLTQMRSAPGSATAPTYGFGVNGLSGMYEESGGVVAFASQQTRRFAVGSTLVCYAPLSINTQHLLFDWGTTPATPGAGKLALWSKDSGGVQRLFTRDAAGTNRMLGGLEVFATLPPASAYKMGDAIYYSTQGIPVFCNGSGWANAMGQAVV